VQVQSGVDPLVDQQASNDLTAMGAPTLQNGDINGYDSINVDGVDDMYEGDVVPTDPNGEYTVAWVGRFYVDTNTFLYGYANGDVNVNGYGLGISDNATSWAIVQGGGDVRLGTTDSNLHRFIITYDGSDSYLEIDGSLIGSGANSAPIDPQGSVSIGGDWADDTFRELDIGEFLFYSEYKNSSERSEIDTYLTNKWGF